MNFMNINIINSSSTSNIFSYFLKFWIWNILFIDYLFKSCMRLISLSIQIIIQKYLWLIFNCENMTKFKGILTYWKIRFKLNAEIMFYQFDPVWILIHLVIGNLFYPWYVLNMTVGIWTVIACIFCTSNFFRKKKQI